MAKTFAELKTLTGQYLGNRTDLTTWTGDWLNMAMHYIEKGNFTFSNGLSVNHNFRHMKIRKTAALASGAYDIATPIPRQKEFLSAFILDSDSRRFPIERKSYNFCMKKYPSLTDNTGRPVYFCETSSTESLALSIGTTADTSVKSTAFDYVISDTVYSKVAAETALAVGTIPQDKWGLYLYSANSAGTITSTAAAANFTTGYATEVLALAAIPTVPAQNIAMGYVTIKTKVGATFVGGTNSLKGGATNPASETNYYIYDVEPINRLIFRPTADTAYTFETEAYHYSPDMDALLYLSNYWTNNHWELLLYGALLEAEPFMINDSRIETWRFMWERRLLALIKAEKNEKLSGQDLTIYAENPLAASNFDIDYIE